MQQNISYTLEVGGGNPPFWPHLFGGGNIRHPIFEGPFSCKGEHDLQAMLCIYIYMTIWDFSEMFLSTIDRLVSSDGGPLLIQFIFDDCVRAKKNDKRSSNMFHTSLSFTSVH